MFYSFSQIDNFIKNSKKQGSILLTTGFIVSIIGLILLYLFMVEILCRQTTSQETSSIANQVLRFHVVANSDTDEDQQLKLELKSWLLESLAPYLSECPDVQSATYWIQNHLLYIQELSEEFLRAKQSSDCVQVSCDTSYFPIKNYGNYTLPPGDYTALRVRIGQAQGHNWWCVLYPQLCFTDETTADFPEESTQLLQENLSEHDYATISGQIPIRWKIAELYHYFFL